MKNMPKLSRRNFLKRAPAAAVAAPVAAKEIAEQRIIEQASIRDFAPILQHGTGVPQSVVNHNKAYELIQRRELEALRKGIVPEHRRGEVKHRVKQLSRFIDTDISVLRSLPIMTMTRMQRARAEKIVLDNMLKDLEGMSVWDRVFRAAMAEADKEQDGN